MLTTTDGPNTADPEQVAEGVPFSSLRARVAGLGVPVSAVDPIASLIMEWTHWMLPPDARGILTAFASAAEELLGMLDASEAQLHPGLRSEILSAILQRPQDERDAMSTLRHMKDSIRELGGRASTARKARGYRNVEVHGVRFGRPTIGQWEIPMLRWSDLPSDAQMLPLLARILLVQEGSIRPAGRRDQLVAGVSSLAGLANERVGAATICKRADRAASSLEESVLRAVRRPVVRSCAPAGEDTVQAPTDDDIARRVAKFTHMFDLDRAAGSARLRPQGVWAEFERLAARDVEQEKRGAPFVWVEPTPGAGNL